MRLSESLVLGSTAVKPVPGLLVGDDGKAGCALGMACLAVGAAYRIATPEELAIDSRTSGVENVWPWLGHSAPYPCGCFAHRSSGSDMAKTVIAHIFDQHVFGAGDWTLDALLAYVRTIEPAEDEYIPDEEPWTDSKTTAEMWNSIKGR